MKLILFATPHENPFPITLEKGIVTSFEGNALLLAGIGERAAERLDAALAAHPAVTGLIEFGGAATVHDAVIGEHYTVTRLFTPSGVVGGALPPVPGLPRAAAVCGSEIYRGDPFPWSGAAGMPLIYTMETASLYAICRRRDLPMYSIRLVTDDGRGDIRGRYQRILATHRAATAELITLLTETP